ncbi:ParB/RepB/Spo0J family partition protein [Nocardia nova]
MPRGGTRKNLADLFDSVGDKSPVDGDHTRTGSSTGTPTSAPLSEIVANPRNPRRDLGDLSDLASIADMQLQSALVVTADAYLRLYPEDADRIGTARWVVVNGCRRDAAARRYGRSDLEIVVKDEVAKDRITFLTAAIDENIGRRDFDVIEEAEAVERLVQECGNSGVAAERLKKSKGWVSQRRALLQLAPELQEALRAGELAVRVARSLAKVPKEAQVAKWRAELERESTKEPTDGRPRPEPQRLPATTPRITKALRRFEPEPKILAEALREYLAPAQLEQLVDALRIT